MVTPKRHQDIFVYENPPSRCSPGGDSYDVPPRAVPIAHDVTRCARQSPAPSCASPFGRHAEEAYDIPRSHQSQQNQLTPSSSASSLTADSLSSSNRSSVGNMPEYDVPRPHPRGPQLVLQPPQHYDVPTSQSLKELPLELSSALENLERLQTDTTSAISKLLSFVGPGWRSREKLAANVMDVKLAVVRLRTSLQDLAEFAEGALGNAARASDKNLASKLLPLVTALRNSNVLIREATDKLNQHEWSVTVLGKLHAICLFCSYLCFKFGAISTELSIVSLNYSYLHIYQHFLFSARSEEEDKKPDELEQLVACSRALTEDVRQTASFIQGNSPLLFKRDVQSQINNNNGDCPEDDYIRLETKENILKQHDEVRNSLPTELKKGYDNLVKHADDVAFDDTKLDQEDKQLLTFFAAQTVTHVENLTQAIDAFLKTVEHNQPPKVFLAHGKFVVLSAHKLVHIGDTVHKNVSKQDVKVQILNCANALSEALATSVAKTKHAALQFPSVTAVQEMVDSVVDISHSARDLKVCLVQAAQPL